MSEAARASTAPAGGPDPAATAVPTAFRASDFGDGFTWGVAHASYQVEGAWDADGKGPSIWDEFTHRRGLLGRSRIRDGSTGDVACDFYHRYREDTALVARLGFRAQRFSVSWPRVLPEGTGRANPAGLDFYARVVDACLEAGVEPWVTLYHWDLPQALQARGGWANRDVLGWFEEYVALVARALGDRVRHWMVFNEPLSFTILGYLAGAHAPGVRSPMAFLRAVHHVNLCQAVGARVLRDLARGAAVGTTQYFAPILPWRDGALFEPARRAVDALVNRLYVEPNLGLGYPTRDLPLARWIGRRIARPGDEQAIRVDWDFLGAQYYTRLRALPLPIPWLRGAPLFGRDFRRYDVTSTGWEVQPDGLYEVLSRLHGYGRFARLVVTENGASFADRLEGDRVRDPRRIAFYEDHLAQVLRARREGVPVDGYFCWSLTDNFEWADGYVPRFGLVYVDYPTQRRIVKDSGRWWRAWLAGETVARGER